MGHVLNLQGATKSKKLKAVTTGTVLHRYRVSPLNHRGEYWATEYDFGYL